LDGLSILKIEKRFKRQNNPFIRFAQSLSLSDGTRTVCANVLNSPVLIHMLQSFCLNTFLERTIFV